MQPQVTSRVESSQSCACSITMSVAVFCFVFNPNQNWTVPQLAASLIETKFRDFVIVAATREKHSQSTARDFVIWSISSRNSWKNWRDFDEKTAKFVRICNFGHTKRLKLFEKALIFAGNEANSVRNHSEKLMAYHYHFSSLSLLLGVVLKS